MNGSSARCDGAPCGMSASWSATDACAPGFSPARWLALLVVTAFAACAPAISVGAQSSRVSPDARGEGLSVAATPIRRFGGLSDDPANELSKDPDVVDAQRLTDGRWLITDRDHLKLYDRTGRLERAIGRKGSGPGEFRHILSACELRDGSIQVLDRQQRRVSRFTAAGRHVRTSAVSEPLEFDGCFSDGTLLVRSAPEALHRVLDRGESPLGLDVHTIFRRVEPSGRTAIRFDSLPFETFSVLRRRVSAVVRRDTFYYAESYRPEVRVYSPQGPLVRRFSITAEQRPVTEALVRAQRSETGRRIVGADEVRTPPVNMSGEPKMVPGLGLMKVGNDGTIWVSSYPLKGERMSWRLLNGDGTVIGRFVVPTLPGFTDVSVVRGERRSVVLRALDDDGAVNLLVFALRP